MNSSNNDFCLSFLKISLDYLHTTENILEQMIGDGNQHVTSGDYSGMENIQKRYTESTKSSDFNVVLPMLFLFYHGIETLLKGLLFLKNPDSDSVIKHQHNLKKLLNETKISYPELSFIKSLEKYLVRSDQTPLILKEFIDSNADIKDINDLYSALRYPTDTSKKENYHYSKLKEREEEGILFAKELKELIGDICLQTVKKYRKNKNSLTKTNL